MASTLRLVGRDAEIAELDREYRLASAGEFRVVLLVADPGLGKTRLAGDFMARKRDRAIGLSGCGHPLSATASFGIWGEALERYLRRLPTAEVRELCGGFTDDLGTLLHTLAALSGPASESTPSRLRLLGGLAAVLFNLTRVRPVIVLLDDAHEADPSSWEALGYFACNLSDARLLALVAVRPFELSENVVATEVLRHLEQDGFLRRLELHRLDTNALGDLARMVVGDEMPSHALLD